MENNLEQKVLFFFQSHTTGTDAEIVQWCATVWGMTAFQVGDCILDLKIDAKIKWHYDHWEIAPGIVILPIKIQAQSVETVITRQTTVVIKQTTTTKTTLSALEMVWAYLKTNPVDTTPTGVRDWVSQSYHVVLTRAQIKDAVKDLRKAGRLSPEKHPASLETTSPSMSAEFLPKRQKQTTDPDVKEVIAQYEEQYHLKCLGESFDTISFNLTFQWECTAFKHQFWRSFAGFKKYGGCPVCHEIQKSNLRRVRNWEHPPKIADDSPKRLQPIPDRVYPNSAEGMLEKYLKTKREKKIPF